MAFLAIAASCSSSVSLAASNSFLKPSLYSPWFSSNLAIFASTSAWLAFLAILSFNSSTAELTDLIKPGFSSVPSPAKASCRLCTLSWILSNPSLTFSDIAFKSLTLAFSSCNVFNAFALASNSVFISSTALWSAFLAISASVSFLFWSTFPAILMSKLALSVACLFIVSIVLIKPGLASSFLSPTNNFVIFLIFLSFLFIAASMLLNESVSLLFGEVAGCSAARV